MPCRIPYENASRTGVHILPNGSNLFVAMHVMQSLNSFELKHDQSLKVRGVARGGRAGDWAPQSEAHSPHVYRGLWRAVILSPG